MNGPLSHRATIRWSRAHEHSGLPTFRRTTDPAWFAEQIPRVDDGWSLTCEFEQPPAAQGNPSAAHVHFMVEKAPHELLIAGARLKLFERATGDYAEVTILD